MNDNLQTMEPTKLRHWLRWRWSEEPYDFRWDGGCLLYVLRNGAALDSRNRERSVIPTASQWQQLWTVCDDIEIWSWPPSLGGRGIIDGLPWSTEIQVGTRSVTSFGQVVGCPPDFVKKLLRLHRAVQALTGWQPPTDDSLLAEQLEATSLAMRSGAVKAQSRHQP